MKVVYVFVVFVSQCCRVIGHINRTNKREGEGGTQIIMRRQNVGLVSWLLDKL